MLGRASAYLNRPVLVNLHLVSVASRLNLQWRVIYRVYEAELEVHVVEVNPHEY